MLLKSLGRYNSLGIFSRKVLRVLKNRLVAVEGMASSG